MKKIISIIAVIAMLFTFTAIPAMAEDVTVNFAEAANIAYGKIIEHAAGTYYSSGPAPSATNQLATDGNLATCHSGNKGPFLFYIPFGEMKKLNTVTLYLDTNGLNKTVNIYNGKNTDAANLLGTYAGAGDAKGRQANVNGSTAYGIVTFEMPANTVANYITVQCTSSSGFKYYEIYVDGETYVDTGLDVDFTAAANIAYQKTITPKAGRNVYVEEEGLTAPSETSQLGTDGDITTYHFASTRTGVASGTTIGSEIGIGFGERKVINSVDLYVQPSMTTSRTGTRAMNSLVINVYGGSDAASGTLIGSMTIPAVNTTVRAGGKTLEMCIYHIDFPENSIYESIAIESSSSYYFGYNEIYVDGETYVDPGVDVDFSAASNILAGKTISHINGHYYGTTTPTAELQNATDGDIETNHRGYGKVNNVKVGVAFSIDLEGKYLLDTFDIYLAAGECGKTFNLYTGDEVDEANLIGTYSTGAYNEKINAGGKSVELAVARCDIPDYIVADHLTVYYTEGSGFTYHEIAATGTAVADDYIAKDFTSEDNLVYGKDNTFVIGHYYGEYTPATSDYATDGNIATTHKATGAYSGEEGYYGFAFKIDLGAYYKLSEITFYTTTKTSSDIIFHSENGYTVTAQGNATEKGGYILNSQGGIVHNGLGKATNATETVNINGTAVYANTLRPSADAEPVRYLIVRCKTGEFIYNELYVAGTPVNELAFAEADFGIDEETGDVKAKVALMNAGNAATSGIIYYAAYNEAGALVGMTTATISSLAAGSTFNTPTTFAVTDTVKSVKAFYWAEGTFVPIITSIDFT